MKVLLYVINVSIDGFLTGIALSLKNVKLKIWKLFIICLIPIIMAFPVMLIGKGISSIINNNIIKYIQSLLFLFMAYNSYRQIKKEEKVICLSLLSIFIIGFTLGLDSSVCAFSLSLENYSPYITPFYFGISHFILILLGSLLFKKIDITRTNYIKYISTIIFLLIAIVKLF